MSTAQKPHPSHKFRIDKATSGDITLLTLAGVLDEGFDGKKVAASVRTRKLVMNLRDVRRFASWGMSEWMGFLRAVADRDLYLVECSSYAVNQINLVTGLLGHGKLVSFYSPYRCGTCSEEFEIPLLVPIDRAAIRDLAESEQVCSTCGGRARTEKYPAAMCAAIAGQPAFDMDDEVIAYLRTTLAYNLVHDPNRLRVFRRVQGDATYLRFSGNLGALPADVAAKATSGTAIVDLSGITYDPGDLTAWRSYVTAVLPAVSTLQLLDCPPGFLEHAIEPEDLQATLKVRSFGLVYHCPSCNMIATRMVDVAQHLEHLSEGTLPTEHCPSCATTLAAAVPPLVTRLPAREHDAALDKFLAKARAEPSDKLENALVAAPIQPEHPPTRSARPIVIGAAVAVLAVGGGVAAAMLWQRTEPPKLSVADEAPVIAPKLKPTFQRPEWIVSGVPSTAFCHDMLNRLVCVGVSAYRPTRNEAVADATDAALDELVNAVGLKITSPGFQERVMPIYSEARSNALAALQGVDVDRTSTAYRAADAVVRGARKRVAEILKVSGGAAVPAQRTDWYWEEYEVEQGSGTESLVFVRFDVTPDAVKALVEKYSTPTTVLESSVLTAFPALAWKFGDFTGGAMVTKAERQLAAAGLGPASLVMAVDGEPLGDAKDLARHLEEGEEGTRKLTVKSGDAAARVIELRR